MPHSSASYAWNTSNVTQAGGGERDERLAGGTGGWRKIAAAADLCVVGRKTQIAQPLHGVGLDALERDACAPGIAHGQQEAVERRRRGVAPGHGDGAP